MDGDRCQNEARLTAEPRRDNACVDGQPQAINQKPKIREMSIKQLDLGYVVRVGCQEFAIETSEKLLVGLGTYLNDPQATEKAWFDGKFLK
jgi:hypothetical protein